MKKILIVFLSICFLLTTTASILGFITHKKGATNEGSNNNNGGSLVSYKYYLEKEQQDEMPVNSADSEVKYIFSSYSCDAGLKGTFDTTLWKFTPNEDKKETCSLYFVKSQYEVSVTAINGIVQNDDDGKFMIPRENEGQFTVVPNEGHKFKSVVCSNEKEALYDISSNTLTINSVMEDVACKVTFEVKKFNIKINVVNGTGSTTEVQKYGSDVKVIVKAKDGYEKPSYSCTNGQKGTWSNNTFTVSRVTDKTTCTITFKKIPVETFTLKITNLPSTMTIVSGNKSQSIKKGTDGKISIKSSTGGNVTLSCNVSPSSKSTDPDGTVNFVFLNVTKDITCSAS